MGNIIITEKGHLRDTELSNLIKKWALNDYDAGLNYGQVYEAPMKNLLKKRACCLRKTSMNIALPTINLENQNTDIIEPGYTSVIINDIYKDDDDLKKNCKFEKNYDYVLGDDFIEKNHQASDVCRFIYEGENGNDGLCFNVKADRAKQLNSEYKIAYGIYTVDEEQLNVYSDCNCLNSTLRNKKNTFEFQNNKDFDPDALAQRFDERCSLLKDHAYKLKNVPGDLCINIVNNQNISVEEQSSLNIEANCNFRKEENDYNAPEETLPANNAPTTNKAPTNNPPTPNKTTASVSSPIILPISKQIVKGIELAVIISIILSILFFIFKMYIL